MSNLKTISNSDKYPEILVGKVIRPWGIQGGIKIVSFSDNSNRFSPGNFIYIEQEKYTILAVKEAKNNLLINLDIIKNITQAESLRGKLIKVYVKDTYALDSGNYYYFQLLDLNVFTESFQYLGDVKDIIKTGANDVYVVSSDDSKEILLPAISEVVLKIDLNKKQMIVKIPKGLL